MKSEHLFLFVRVRWCRAWFRFQWELLA